MNKPVFCQISAMAVKNGRKRSWPLYLVLCKRRYKTSITSDKALLHLSSTTGETKTRHISHEKCLFWKRQFFFRKSGNASQVAEIVNSVYGVNTVTANYMQFWFRRFRSGIFDVKDAPRTGRPVVENVDKITEIIEVDRLVSSRSIAQGL
ncbi:histone-lysine N-methyltransferase SETMAR [Trichonephila clavipes]|nr:histone-lysine N-methyltransferase SETMAR [Trichonephila clavipes]